MKSIERIVAIVIAIITTLCTMTACGSNAREMANTQENNGCFEEQVETVTTTTSKIESLNVQPSHDIEEPTVWVKSGNMLPVDEKSAICDLLTNVGDTKAIKDVLETKMVNFEAVYGEANLYKEAECILKNVEKGYFVLNKVIKSTTRISWKEVTEILEHKKTPVLLNNNDGEMVIIVGFSSETLWYLGKYGYGTMNVEKFNTLAFKDGIYLEPKETLDRHSLRIGNLPVTDLVEIARNFMVLQGDIKKFNSVPKMANLEELRKFLLELDGPGKENIVYSEVKNFQRLSEIGVYSAENLAIVENVSTGEYFIWMGDISIGGHTYFEAFLLNKNGLETKAYSELEAGYNVIIL